MPEINYEVIRKIGILSKANSGWALVALRELLISLELLLIHQAFSISPGKN